MCCFRLSELLRNTSYIAATADHVPQIHRGATIFAGIVLAGRRSLGRVGSLKLSAGPFSGRGDLGEMVWWAFLFFTN